MYRHFNSRTITSDNRLEYTKRTVNHSLLQISW